MAGYIKLFRRLVGIKIFAKVADEGALQLICCILYNTKDNVKQNSVLESFKKRN
jgi:hypothetical protein